MHAPRGKKQQTKFSGNTPRIVLHDSKSYFTFENIRANTSQCQSVWLELKFMYVSRYCNLINLHENIFFSVVLFQFCFFVERYTSGSDTLQLNVVSCFNNFKNSFTHIRCYGMICGARFFLQSHIFELERKTSTKAIPRRWKLLLALLQFRCGFDLQCRCIRARIVWNMHEQCI